MDEMGPEAEDVLNIARAARTPTEADRRRIGLRLSAVVGAGAAIGLSAASVKAASALSATAANGAIASGGVGTTAAVGATAAVGTTAAVGSTAAAKLGLGIWLTASAGLLTTVAIGASVVVLSDSKTREVDHAASAGELTVDSNEPPRLEVADPSDSEVEAERSDIEPRRARATHSRSARRRRPLPREAEPAADLAAELELLHRAQSAWRSGNAARALTLVQEHERQFHRTQLAPERTALRILVLCELGRTQQAQRLGRHFLRNAGQSPSRRSVEESCAGQSP